MTHKVDPNHPHWRWSVEITEAEMARLSSDDWYLLQDIFTALGKSQDMRIFDSRERHRTIAGSGSLSLREAGVLTCPECRTRDLLPQGL